jgi:hypothetical protein
MDSSATRQGATNLLVWLFHWLASSVQEGEEYPMDVAYSTLYSMATTWLQVSPVKIKK